MSSNGQAKKPVAKKVAGKTVITKKAAGHSAMINRIKAQQTAINEAKEAEERAIKEAEQKEREEERIAKKEIMMEKEEKADKKVEAKKSRSARILDQKEQQRLRIISQLQNQTSTVKNVNPIDEMDVICDEEPSIHRTPICCVLGHTDTGKTSLLDKLRRSKVQAGETAGITQQIGATSFPKTTIANFLKDYKLENTDESVIAENQGVLLIDTPGHESFTNLRKQGGSLSDIAILVIDIMHGIENQTLESIRLLKANKCPFIVALNKIDRIYGWNYNDAMDFQSSYSLQKKDAQDLFNVRLDEIKLKLAENGFNAELFCKNSDFRNIVSIVPTSAAPTGIAGEGIIDLIYMMTYLSQSYMKTKLMIKDNFEAHVFETKSSIDLGTTIDIIMINGSLNSGDTIMMVGLYGDPIMTKVKSILIPNENVEQRTSKQFARKQIAHATQIVKVCADGLEHVIPGSTVRLVSAECLKDPVQLNLLKDSIRKEAEENMELLKLKPAGISIQCPTFGSIEALCNELGNKNINVHNANIGEIRREHLIKTKNAMEKCTKDGIMLAFDVTISPLARKYAQDNNITIFEDRTIYRLIIQYENWLKEYDENMKRQLAARNVFPVQMEIIDHFLNRGYHIVMGCKVLHGKLVQGTPLYFTMGSGEIKELGRVHSIQNNNKDVESATPGSEVGVKIHNPNNMQFGRHFDKGTVLKSRITRDSLNVLKKLYLNELTVSMKALIIALKKELQIN